MIISEYIDLLLIDYICSFILSPRDLIWDYGDNGWHHKADGTQYCSYAIMYNMPHHMLSKQELYNKFAYYYESGLITFKEAHTKEDIVSKVENHNNLFNLFDDYQKHPIWIWPTAKCVEIWEKAFAVDISKLYQHDEDDHEIIYAYNDKFMEKYLLLLLDNKAISNYDSIKKSLYHKRIIGIYYWNAVYMQYMTRVKWEIGAGHEYDFILNHELNYIFKYIDSSHLTQEAVEYYGYLLNTVKSCDLSKINECISSSEIDLLRSIADAEFQFRKECLTFWRSEWVKNYHDGIYRIFAKREYFNWKYPRVDCF